MSQFTLIWNNSALLVSSNALTQTAEYRYRLVGGAYISTGFSPTNPLAKAATTTDSPTLDDNKVIQFKIQTDCTTGGPSDNDNGLQEVINFIEIIPTITKTDTTANITIDATGTDITKARLTLRKASDNSIVDQIIVNKVSNNIIRPITGLSYSTNYYWQVEFYANVNSIEVLSSAPSYNGVVFSPYPFTTNAPAVCDPVTSVTVTSVEVP